MTATTGKPLYDAAHWRRLRELADQLDTLDGDARAAALREVQDADPQLAERVRALLDSESGDDVDALSAAVQRTLPTDAAPMPERIGPFRLLRPLGAGGMGVVYLAERVTPEFTQRVALKLLDGDATRVSRLVARERRALAALNHPNITAFIDAGADGGCAWLAMEHVDGEPLLTYCARHDLSIRERVHLFEQICAAVAHAHGQLVVHRDLKPANVLVTTDGTVKLLDFGIALILDPSAEQTPATRVFTPEYAAPEQLRGERATTATDIHALGLMLFEVMTGTRLPVLERGATHEEWRTAQLARLVDPHAPTGTTRELRGDLGRILAHALAPDPAQRYASALQLREDLQRWREYRPITIARPSVRYVAARFVRRNGALVAVAMIAVLALIGATAFALHQASVATRMAARAEHSKNFLADLLRDANPFASKTSGKSNIALLEGAARRLDAEFFGSPDDQIELRQILAGALSRLGEPKLARSLQQRSVAQIRLRSDERSPQLGDALATLAQTTEDSGDIESARRLFEEAYANLQDAGPAYRKSRLSAMTGLAKMANRRSDFVQGQVWYERVLQERLAQEGPESPDIAMDLYDVGVCALYQEHYAQALDLIQRAHAMLERTLGAGHPRFMYVDLGLGITQASTGDVDAAIKTLSGTLTLARAHLKPGAAHIGVIESALAKAYWFAGDDAAAMASAASSLAVQAAANAPGLGSTELTLGRAQLRLHKREALQTLAASREHLQADSARSAGNARFLAVAHAAHGAALAQFGDAAAGEREAREARANLLSAFPDGGEKLAEIDVYLADVLDAQGKTDEARSTRGEALATFRRVYGNTHPVTRRLAAQLETPI